MANLSFPPFAPRRLAFAAIFDRLNARIDLAEEQGLMLRLSYGIRLLVVAILAGACAGRGDVQLTLVSENVALSTEMADIRSTATYAADQLQMTLEYVQTAVTQVALQHQTLSLTLVAAGVDPAAITPGAPVPTQPIPGNPVAPVVTQEAVVSGAATTPLITPTGPVSPSLYNAVMAEAVGENDCAVGAVSSFSPATERIYVVATAANIPPQTTLASRWFSQGVEAVVHQFTPDFTIEQNCVWFFIDQSDATFTPGSWSVQLEINGAPAGSPLTFSIIE